MSTPSVPALGSRAVTDLTAEERRLSDVIGEQLRPMLASDPQLVHFPSLARAVQQEIDRLPRIPLWRGEHAAEGGEGGIVLVDLRRDGRIGITADHDDGGRGVLVDLDVAAARALFLAGLAACEAASNPARAVDEDVIDTPRCATTDHVDTLTGKTDDRREDVS